jgi:hypothetical protein
MHSAIPGWNDYINDDVTESPAYLVGQVACGIAFPYATLARDFTADMLRGDYAGASLSSLGYLGKVRTLLGTTDAIPLFIAKNVAKNPQKVDSGQEIMSHLWKQGIYHTELPAIEKAAMLDKAFDGAATRLSGQGVADDVIAGVYERGGNIGKTLHIVESESSGVQHIWLEQGRLVRIDSKGKDVGGYGWEHIMHNHMYYGLPREHFDTVLGAAYANENAVKQLIYDGAKYGTQMGKPGYLYKIYDVPGTTRQIRIGLYDNGKIKTAYPVI